jgi:peptide deformylase
MDAKTDYRRDLIMDADADAASFDDEAMQRLGAKIGLPEGVPGEVRTELVPYPHPALLRVAQPCTDNMWEEGIIQEMADVLALVRAQLAAMKVDSYAVAAPQIAIPFRAFLWDNNGAPMALFNPQIVETSIDKTWDDEQCLSFLGKYYAAANRFDAGLSAQVERSQRVVVRGFTVTKEYVEVEAVDIVARMMQHEIDHLDGITMIDRLATRQMQRAALRHWYKMHPELKEAA